MAAARSANSSKPSAFGSACAIRDAEKVAAAPDANFADGLRRAGVEVPSTVSVVGFDDSPISRLAHLDLTTVSQEPEEQARLAVRAAVERLEGVRNVARDTVLRPRLVVRGSTAPPDEQS